MTDYRKIDDETYRKVLEVNVLLSILDYCTECQGAEINITIAHDKGFVATAHLYDHAALVQGLQDALKYFQSELYGGETSG